MQVWFLLLLAFLISIISIFCVILFSTHFGLYDRIDERKVHTGNIPRLGGIGVFLGFLAGLIIFGITTGTHNFLGRGVWNLVVACSMIFIMGVWDDVSPWRARYKLFVQCLAGIIAIAAGLKFTHINFGPADFSWDMGFLSYPLTFFWIIGVTNAVNLIDGIDGLAGSISAMAALIYALVFYQNGSNGPMLVCVLLAVAIVGFLVFNLPFPRAKIFMGDGGSQFLGFTLAILPLLPNPKGEALIALPYAAAVLIIPIFDTIAAIWRRVREKRSIDSPDKFHLHHKLMMMGFTAPHALLVLVLFQLIIGLLMITSMWLHGVLALILLFAVYLMGILFFTVIHIRKEEILEKSSLLK
jgi:UDP-N-acetylmuramyl pentapeptide phosphotransferase/UDP-N-acetylglucosamine-1-phosphate transferase